MNVPGTVVIAELYQPRGFYIYCHKLIRNFFIFSVWCSSYRWIVEEKVREINVDKIGLIIYVLCLGHVKFGCFIVTCVLLLLRNITAA